MNRRITLVLGLILSFSVAAHQDTVIKLTKDGSLVGLPNEYLPASFDHVNWKITIGDSKFTFPSCFPTQLSGLETKDFEIKSSWYNPVYVLSDTEISSFPSYMRISIREKGISVLLSLDTAKPFDSTHPEYAELTTDEICELIPPPKK